MSAHHDAPDPLMNAATRPLTRPELKHDEAVIGLATTRGNAAPHALWDTLDQTARPLFGLAHAPLHEQAGKIAAAITNRLGLSATTDRHGHLLLNHALADRAAHPILLATLGHELARHAGLSSVVDRSRNDYWTLLTCGDTFLPIGYSSRTTLISSELEACCAHEIAHRSCSGSPPTEPPRAPGEPIVFASRSPQHAAAPARPAANRSDHPRPSDASLVSPIRRRGGRLDPRSRRCLDARAR